MTIATNTFTTIHFELKCVHFNFQDLPLLFEKPGITTHPKGAFSITLEVDKHSLGELERYLDFKNKRHNLLNDHETLEIKTLLAQGFENGHNLIQFTYNPLN
jgi:hypothetical protein